MPVSTEPLLLADFKMRISDFIYGLLAIAFFFTAAYIIIAHEPIAVEEVNQCSQLTSDIWTNHYRCH